MKTKLAIAIAAVVMLIGGLMTALTGAASAGTNGQQIYFTNNSSQTVTATVWGVNQDNHAVHDTVTVPAKYTLYLSGWWWKSPKVPDKDRAEPVYITWSNDGGQPVDCLVPISQASNWFNCGSIQ